MSKKFIASLVIQELKKLLKPCGTDRSYAQRASSVLK